MSNTLNKDLNDAISQNLPAMVGEQLKERLTQADDLEKLNAKFKVDAINQKAEITRLTTKCHILSDLKHNVEANETKRRELEIRSAILEERTNCLREMKEFTQLTLTAVFGNNKFKYQTQEYGSHDEVTTDNNGYASTHNLMDNKTTDVSSEG